MCTLADYSIVHIRRHSSAHFQPAIDTRVGRRRHDHRTVLGGILWVLRSAAPWREMPARFGKCNSVYVRYRLWRQQDLWSQIIEALGPDAIPPARAGPPYR